MDTLDNQTALEFGDGTQNSKNHAARGRRRVDLFSETHKSDSQRVESFECAEQMRDAPGEAVELPNYNDIEAPLMCVYHEPVKLRTPILRAGYPDVDVTRSPSSYGADSIRRNRGSAFPGFYGRCGDNLF
jgi:hypothetical protein